MRIWWRLAAIAVVLADHECSALCFPIVSEIGCLVSYAALVISRQVLDSVRDSPARPGSHRTAFGPDNPSFSTKILLGSCLQRTQTPSGCHASCRDALTDELINSVPGSTRYVFHWKQYMYFFVSHVILFFPVSNVSHYQLRRFFVSRVRRVRTVEHCVTYRYHLSSYLSCLKGIKAQFFIFYF